MNKRKRYDFLIISGFSFLILIMIAISLLGFTGLEKESIPLLSRIVSIVDAYDAMTQDRPYRKAMPEAEAINEIKANAGTQFDPKIANLFVEILSRQ